MFDFSWSEMMIIGGVALIAIGPKDLPKALKTAGQLVRKAKGLAREFHNSIDEMIRESELDDIRKSMQEATRIDVDPPLRPPVPATQPPLMTGPTPHTGTLAAEPSPAESALPEQALPVQAPPQLEEEPELPFMTDAPGSSHPPTEP